MSGLAAILAAARPLAGGFAAEIPAGWMQGRTAYGGLSSALALHAAQQAGAGLPPLRSALVSFIGPLAGEVAVTAQVLRRGRNAAFVQADIHADGDLAYRATFTFMAERPSAIDLDRRAAPPPDRSRPGDAEAKIGPPDFFTGQFAMHEPPGGGDPASWQRWVRLRERGGVDPVVELMAVADALPPAALKLLGGRLAPLSSLTWILNLLTPAPATADGWWLLDARTDLARAGGSSQVMRLWSDTGELVAEGMQSVAIFA